MRVLTPGVFPGKVPVLQSEFIDNLNAIEF